MTAPAPEAVGVAPDLGRDLAAQLGVPVRFVGYAHAGHVADAASRDEWDVAFIGADAARAGDVWFSRAYVGIEATYLVPAGSEVREVSDVDRAGMRIAVADRSAYHLELQRIIRHATLVPAPGLPESAALFASGGLEALAGLRPHLLSVAATMPGSVLLEGAFMTVRQAMGVPRARQDAASLVARFVDAAIMSGRVDELIARHQVRGLTPPPA